MTTSQVRFGPYCLDLKRRQLLHEGAVVKLGNRTLDILCLLVSANGNLVTKDELLARVWPDTVVEESNIHVHVSALRKALDQEQAGQTYVVTVPGRGYRFIGLEAVSPDGAKADITLNPVAPDKPAIAVLPFVNLSGDLQQEYFADGIVEDIITELSRFRELFVIARNSTFQYKGKPIDVRQMARRLDARYLLEGSVRKVDRNIRVIAQLVDGSTGRHIWAERFDCRLDDIFHFQDDIVQRIASTVAPNLTRVEFRRAAIKRSEELDAWDYFLRGMSTIRERTCKTNAEARAWFEKAIAVCPDYADAYSGIAMSYSFDVIFECVEDPIETATLAMNSAQNALKFDETSSVAHRELSTAYQLLNRQSDALAEGRLAVDLNPNDAIALQNFGNKSDLAGDPGGTSYMEAARKLNPMDIQIHTYLTFMARAHFNAGSFEIAVDRASQALRRRHDHAPAHYMLALALAQLGRIKEAGVALAKCEELRPGFIRTRENWQPYANQSSNVKLHEALGKIKRKARFTEK